jgi:hypothetical protein
MHVYEFEGKADVLQKRYLLDAQKKNGKTSAPIKVIIPRKKEYWQ